MIRLKHIITGAFFLLSTIVSAQVEIVNEEP